MKTRIVLAILGMFAVQGCMYEKADAPVTPQPQQTYNTHVDILPNPTVPSFWVDEDGNKIPVRKPRWKPKHLRETNAKQ